MLAVAASDHASASSKASINGDRRALDQRHCAIKAGYGRESPLAVHHGNSDGISDTRTFFGDSNSGILRAGGKRPLFPAERRTAKAHANFEGAINEKTTSG